jgi:hypothetical protein
LLLGNSAPPSRFDKLTVRSDWGSELSVDLILSPSKDEVVAPAQPVQPPSMICTCPVV